MTQDGHDRHAWHFIRTVYADIYPSIRNLSYRFEDNRTGKFEATCANSSDTTSTPCMNGTFNETGFLSLTMNDTRNNNTRVSHLRAVDNDWVPSPADDAPSYILKEVHDDCVGDIAVRTAVTMKGDCTLLKICVANETIFDVLPAVGLTLYRHDQYAEICTTPTSN